MEKTMTLDVNQLSKLVTLPRSQEQAKSRLIAANIIDPKTGGYSSKFFTEETVRNSLRKVANAG